ncbi:MAG: transcription termination factor NusA [Gemmatimonadetes bacterium]|jgi:N utilization substance protein A|nr:transcription termination factor NusA [Gemmatimonadota bacterium]MBT5059944.1 transcription termination factor NusA [Gemmatimonadota bacterium]MBT5141955.1 transcription termination factor NusA [Gemmatimonadota bacterium]MBT5589755.1 transcription termination factor NusA [Gemmatimonadota bacterium]MBT5964068.1 transcription termination factor NusA [Gemmatimonadota bacterium]
MNANLNIIEALGQIAREKNVDRDMVIETLADALVSAARKRYGNGDNFEAQIDPETGSMAVMARKTVVDEVNEPDLEIELEPAQEIDHQAQLGSVVFEELNLADFGRNAIQTAKQILIQRVREAERERIYEEFASRISHIEVATVQQISHGDIILQLGRAEAAVPLKEQIRRERYRQGDSVRGYVFEVIKSVRGPQVLLSRTHPEFLRKLFALEVPEIAEGIVQIHAVAREPGERAKIAVSSNDERVDPVGACVGVKGSRVQAVVRELSGERIDIVPWIDEPDIFISRALSPATVTRVITDERRHHAQVIVDEEQLSLAIGKSGQNSRLAVQLTGWGLDIITEDEYQRRLRRLEESKVELRRLDGVSELIALSLATSGFISLRGIAESEADMLETVPGLEGQATQLREQAIAYVAAAEASGEQLRPATIEEVEAEERAADQRRAAESAAEEAKRAAESAAEEAKRATALAAAEVELAAQDAAAAEAKAEAEAAKAEAAVVQDDAESGPEVAEEAAEEVAGEQMSGDDEPSADAADASEETSSTQTQVEEAGAAEADDGSDLDAASAASESGNDDGAAGV